MVASFVTENASRRVLTSQGKNKTFGGSNENSNRILVAANELKENEKLLDFSILIDEKTDTDTISIVSVVENNETAENNISYSRSQLKDISAHYKSGDIKVDTNLTVDNSFCNAIGRVSKELFADIILINDNTKTNFFQRIIGDDRELLLDQCDKTVFFCHLEHPFTEYRKIILSCPPYSELQANSTIWADRVFRLAKELNLKIDVFATEKTFDKFNDYKNTKCQGLELKHIDISVPDDIVSHANDFDKSCLFINVFARSGTVSAYVGMDSLPQRLEREIKSSDRIFIYPSNIVSSHFASYDDMSENPISAGVETIQRLSKEVGGMFKKNTDEK